MRKLFTIFPLCIVLCLLTGGCSTADANEENYEEEIATVSYDNNTDYMSLMVQYAAAGNMDALGAAVTARNEKIANQQLGYEQLSVDEFLNNYESYAGFSLDTDYMSQMVSCCLSGDVAGGLEAERLRNLKVASPEFPDSIEECIYQTGQYYSRGNQYFANLLPYEDCVEAALRLLNGERIINDGSVVFQANFRQGSGTYLKLYDQQLGYTYLCYSSYPELYES